MQHIHFLGIGGIGVSALAQVAQARGARVSGSDLRADPQTNPALQRLSAGGATLYTGHAAANLAEDVDLVVASAAITETNLELRAAQERGIRIVSRAAFLGELMAAHKGVKIAVAGTHGKTTTTAMLGVMLQHAGLDPTVFVGGEVAALGGNARIGSDTGPFIAEACEAYDSFLYLKPDIAVLTNIEADHLDHYGTEERVFESFRQFLSNVPPSGKVVAYLEDAGVQCVLDGIELEVIGYGRTASSRAEEICLGWPSRFRWVSDAGSVVITLSVPGRHNISNAVAAATVGEQIGMPRQTIADGLAAFTGAERRQDILGEVSLGTGSVLVIDDYAHHPTEIRATLDALRSAYPKRRLVAVFQPHLYSRTRDFLPEFAHALAEADALLVTDIYAAREAPIPGVRAADIVNQATERNPNAPVLFVPDKKELPSMLRALIQPNDVAVFLGAGDVREQGEIFLQLLRQEANG